MSGRDRELAALLRLGLAISLLSGLAACGGADEAPAPQPAQAAREAASAPQPAADPSNAPPRIQAIRLEPEDPTVGGTLRAVVEAFDADGDALWFRYAWAIEGEPVAGNGPELALAGLSKGDSIEVAVVANDGKDESPEFSERATIANTAPRLHRVEIVPEGGVAVGTPIVVRPEARDADGDPVSFEYEWSVNGRGLREEGASLSTESLRRGDSVEVAIVATDGEAESEPFATQVSVVNSPPRIVSRPGESSADGAFRYRVVAEDPDGDLRLQYHLEEAPEGMSIDAVRGEITWLPKPGQAGRHPVSVIVDDLQGGRTRHRFEVTVGGSEPLPAAGSP